MLLDEYQENAARFARYPSDVELDYLIHGLTSEAGEVAGLWKKQLRLGVKTLPTAEDISLDHKELHGKAVRELGDVLWYVSQLARRLGVSLSEVALSNLEKLEGRAEQGTLAVVSRDLPLEDVLPDGTLLAEKDNTLWRVDPEGTHVDWFHHDGSVVENLTPSEKWACDAHRGIRSNNTIMLRLSRVR
jgi:NTP pyrophosphatase (non-canonical NTP hydrolase)